MAHLTPVITSAPTATSTAYPEISWCDCLVERISAIWQAVYKLILDCYHWLTVPAAVYEKAPLAIAVKAPEALHLPRAEHRRLRDVIDACHTAWSMKFPKEENDVPDFSPARSLLHKDAAWREETPLIALIKKIQLEERFTHKTTELHRKACADFAIELIRAYVQAGVTLDDKDQQLQTLYERGGTALHYAVVVAVSGNGKLDLSVQYCPEFVPVAETLIASGADLEAEDTYGSTPLGTALKAFKGRPKERIDLGGCANRLIDTLLRQGANLGARISNADARPLSALALDPKERATHAYNAVITQFINDRFTLICASTPLPPPLQTLTASYLEGGAVLDPLPAS